MVIWDVIAPLRVDFSECFSFTYNETCVVRCSVGYTGVGDNNTTEFIGDSDGHFQGSFECAEESLELSTVRTLAERVLSCDEHFVQINGNKFLQGTELLRTTTWMTIPSRSSETQAEPCSPRVRQAPWESSTAPGGTVRRTRGSFGMTKTDPDSFKISPAEGKSSLLSSALYETRTRKAPVSSEIHPGSARRQALVKESTALMKESAGSVKERAAHVKEPATPSKSVTRVPRVSPRLKEKAFLCLRLVRRCLGARSCVHPDELCRDNRQAFRG